MKILAIDDSSHERKRLKLTLAYGNIFTDIMETENGQEGLDALTAHSAEIGLIILDWHMPVMDGPAFLQEFIKHPEWAGIKIIMATSFKGEEREQYIRKIFPPLSAYVVKPYQLEDMIRIVKRTVNENPPEA